MSGRSRGISVFGDMILPDIAGLVKRETQVSCDGEALPHGDHP